MSDRKGEIFKFDSYLKKSQKHNSRFTGWCVGSCSRYELQILVRYRYTIQIFIIFDRNKRLILKNCLVKFKNNIQKFLISQRWKIDNHKVALLATMHSILGNFVWLVHYNLKTFKSLKFEMKLPNLIPCPHVSSRIQFSLFLSNYELSSPLSVFWNGFMMPGIYFY